MSPTRYIACVFTLACVGWGDGGPGTVLPTTGAALGGYPHLARSVTMVRGYRAFQLLTARWHQCQSSRPGVRQQICIRDALKRVPTSSIVRIIGQKITRRWHTCDTTIIYHFENSNNDDVATYTHASKALFTAVERLIFASVPWEVTQTRSKPHSSIMVNAP